MKRFLSFLIAVMMILLIKMKIRIIGLKINQKYHILNLLKQILI